MKRCPACGFPLPEGCPVCPPRVVRCPRCGAECLIEAMAEDVAAEILREYGKMIK